MPQVPLSRPADQLPTLAPGARRVCAEGGLLSREAGTMREIVAIWYRGANYQIGRGRDFYGIWPMERPAVQPLEWWPLTGEGWFGAWSRFVDIETPGTIVPGDQPA